MKNHSLVDNRRQNDDHTPSVLISFPACFRVRCPRCGAASSATEPGRYSCQSADDSQSEACVTRAKERSSTNLMAETQAILQKFGFGPVSRLQVVG